VKKIDRPQTIRMLATAAAFDALQGFLTASYVGIVFSPLVSALAAYVFWRWFKRYDGAAPDPRQNPRLFTILLEFVPALNALPLWTITVALSIAAHNRQGEL
jgi:hypothetical protein